MGTIAEKLAHLMATKTAIKEAIAANGGAITDATPFSEYPNLIQAIAANGGGDSGDTNLGGGEYPEDGKEWKTLMNFGGEYKISYTDAATSESTAFAAGEFPLQRSCEIVSADASVAGNYCYFTSIPTAAQGKSIEIEVRFPEVTFDGVDYTHVRYYYVFRRSSASTADIDILYDSAEGNEPVVTNHSIMSEYTSETIYENGEIVGCRISGVLYRDMRRIEMSVLPLGLSGSDTYTFSSTVVQSDHRDLRYCVTE